MSGKFLLAVGLWGLTAVAVRTPAAFAQSGNAPLAVLGLEATDGAPAAVANSITDALKQRVSAAKGFKLMPGKDLMEVKLVFSCPDEAPSCMAQAAKSLGAEKLIFGSVKKAADGYLVTLKMLDATKGRVDAWVAEQIARTQATTPGLRGPVQKWFATLSGVGTNGAIRITSDVVGASVLLDNLPVGVTTEDPLELGSITTGRHEIVISKPGYEPVRKNVDVIAGETANVRAAMDAVGQGTAPGPVDATASSQEMPTTDAAASGDDRSGLKIATWSTLGAGVVALALGVKFSLDVKGYDSDLDQYRRYDCGDGMALCKTRGSGEPEPLTKEEQAKVREIQDNAKSPETLQWVFYGAGAVLVGAGVYLYTRAYLADDTKASEGDVALAKRVHFAPVITPTGAGLSARLTF
ncbi:MAG: PEGA domain-containing protein [Deltaproteobacteria bacterium]|nr:PEGA domain-containing protein [Deltaproteobacteria bacterium]